MRVLMTTDTLGGVWTYAIELARSAAPLGVEYILATMGAPLSEAQRRQVEALPNVTLRESSYRLEWQHKPWDDVRRAGDRLVTLEHEFQPDLVHLNGYAHAQWPFAVPTLVVGHSCVWSWWEAVKGELPGQEWARYRSEVWAGLRRADLVVAPSQAMLAALDRHYGPLPPSRVIYNGRDPRNYRAAAKQEVILTAGRVWDEAKNVAALAGIADKLPWKVCVAGDDQHPDGGRAETKGLQFLGRLDEPAMAEAFSQAAIYCLPARYEPFGLSALEAALSGCALVLGDIPSLREIWGNDGAVYVPPNDPHALQEALLGLIRHPAERAERARLANLHAQKYTPVAMAQGYMACYRELLLNSEEPSSLSPRERAGVRVRQESQRPRQRNNPDEPASQQRHSRNGRPHTPGAERALASAAPGPELAAPRTSASEPRSTATPPHLRPDLRSALPGGEGGARSPDPRVTPRNRGAPA